MTRALYLVLKFFDYQCYKLQAIKTKFSQFCMKFVFQGCQSGVRSLYATADLLAEVC